MQSAKEQLQRGISTNILDLFKGLLDNGLDDNLDSETDNFQQTEGIEQPLALAVTVYFKKISFSILFHKQKQYFSA